MTRLRPGVPAPGFSGVEIGGQRLRLDDFEGRPLLLSFFREAGCPFCNIRVYELTQHYGRFREQGLAILAVFSSPAEDIRHYVAQRPRPFVMLTDPEQELYRLYGVEHSAPKMWWGVVRHFGRMIRGFSVAPVKASRDATLVPADFLIDETGVIRDAHYGRDIGDHIPIERIQTFLYPRILPLKGRHAQSSGL